MTRKSFPVFLVYAHAQPTILFICHEAHGSVIFEYSDVSSLHVFTLFNTTLWVIFSIRPYKVPLQLVISPWTLTVVVASVPTNCADTVQMNSSAPDGEYILYRDDGPIRLYCHDMAGNPISFITLRDPESNYGEHYNYGARTKFSRVAVDPQVGRQNATKSSQTNRRYLDRSFIITEKEWGVITPCENVNGCLAKPGWTATSYKNHRCVYLSIPSSLWITISIVQSI